MSSYITIGLLAGRAAAGHATRPSMSKPNTTVGYDQSDRSYHRDPTFVLMPATAR
jgi:hypothetical protein